MENNEEIYSSPEHDLAFAIYEAYDRELANLGVPPALRSLIQDSVALEFPFRKELIGLRGITGELPSP